MAPSKTCFKSDLARELADFRITASPLNPDFHFEDMLSEVNVCRVVKENNRRQVYHLETSDGSYFLKRSSLVRTKDRLRHFLLPRRRWAEWHNLHRLLRAGIPAAKPILRGENVATRTQYFFLLTEKVGGLPLQGSRGAESGRIGAYVAKLHSQGIYHTDLHPNNIIVTPAGQFCLIDVQEVYFLPWLPRWMRVRNLAKLYLNLGFEDDAAKITAEFIAGYNQALPDDVDDGQLLTAAGRHQRRKYRSRARRSCMNSTEFEVVKHFSIRGYQRRNFDWGAPELEQALEAGQYLKGDHVLCHQGVCIKKHPKRIFHRDRCMASWKMSRCLEVRGIATPRSLGYFAYKGNAYFLAIFLSASQHLNNYLSKSRDPRQTRRILKDLALWVKKIHDTQVWQRDFKSSNILYQNGDFFMVDLDGVKIRRLSQINKITNIAQLNASISNAISLKDRIRFLHYYWANENVSRKERRGVYRKVWEISKKKNTKVFGLDLTQLELKKQI